MYIVTQLVSKKEKAELQQTFTALDKNADGKLSREELVEGYTIIYAGNQVKAIKEVEIIMTNVDVDHNGYIDYSEFLVASMNKKQLLSKGNLQRAFSLFDRVKNYEVKLNLGREWINISRRIENDLRSWQAILGKNMGRSYQTS